MTELLCQQLADAQFGKTGRRSFFEYRDTGISDLTDGEYRAQVMRATDVMDTTGWHYHQCDLLFVYVLNGWVDLEFEGGRSERVSAGAVVYSWEWHAKLVIISFEALEIVAPAQMETVPCDPPA